MDLKVGDKVRLVDHSYHVDLLKDGSLGHCCAPGGFHKDDELLVAAVDCKFPIMYSASEGAYTNKGELHPVTVYDEHNNTLVYNKTKGMYFFTMNRLLCKTAGRCPLCNKELDK